MALAEIPRFDALWNFRDAGGYPTASGQLVRSGIVYRSDGPQQLTERDRQLIDSFGFTTVIDLRTAAQASDGTRFLPPDRTISVPIIEASLNWDKDPPPFDTIEHMVTFYRDVVALGSQHLARAVTLIGERLDGTILVHCNAGKDRTGLVIGLVHLLLGVSLDDAVTDYALSDEPIQRRVAFVRANPRRGEPPYDRLPPLITRAPAEVMHTYLSEVLDQHGSAEAWATHLGVTEETISTLRAGLLSD